MKCFVCRFGETAPGTTILTLNRDSLTLVVKEVPADVCDACGEGYVQPEISAQLQEIANDAKGAGVEVLVRKYIPAQTSHKQACSASGYASAEEQVNGIQRQPVEGFIAKLGLTPEQYIRKERANGYQLYVNALGRQRRFGYVRLNKSGEHAGMMVVYAIGNFRDPENRFQSQPKNPKDCLYRFSPSDESAVEYAVHVVKSAYEGRL